MLSLDLQILGGRKTHANMHLACSYLLEASKADSLLNFRIALGVDRNG